MTSAAGRLGPGAGIRGFRADTIRFTRIRRDRRGRIRDESPLDPGIAEELRALIRDRARIALECAPRDRSAVAGIDLDRVRGFFHAKGLAVRPVVVTDRPSVRRWRAKLAEAGYSDPFGLLADPGSRVMGSYVPAIAIAISYWAEGLPRFTEAEAVVHELAHGTITTPQEWTAELLPGGTWDLWIRRRGYVAYDGPKAAGEFIEEGWAALMAGEYARDVLGGQGLLPARRVPRHLADIAGYVWELPYSPDDPAWSTAAYAAVALQLLADARPGLDDALIRARNDPAGLDDVARTIDSVRPGLYRRLQSLPYTDDGFRAGLDAVRTAL